MSHAFKADCMQKAQRRNRKWYEENLMPVLNDAKERRVREIDVSIALGKELLEILNEPRPKPIEVPPHDIVPSEDDSLMKSIEPEVLDLFYGCTEKGGAQKYLDMRNKKAPEDKFFVRLCTNWDYGWEQRSSRLRARDVNHGRCAILRDTFYRKNNLAPDPVHYAHPSGGEVSVCSQYACHFS